MKKCLHILFLLTAFLANALGFTNSFTGNWLATNSNWNTPIPTNVLVLSNSAAIISAYASYVSTNHGAGAFNANIDYWTPAVIYAPKGTATTNLSWSIWKLKNVPLGPGTATMTQAQAIATYYQSKGDTDARLCVYSEDFGVFFYFEGIRSTNGNFTIAAGNVGPLNGGGWWNDNTGPWVTASGVELTAGMIRTNEWAAGVIPHAVAVCFPFKSNLQGASAYPSTTTDGQGTNSTSCIKQGQLVQLDPTLTDSALTNMGVSTKYLMICHAMQQYGAYDMDSTSSSQGAICFQASLGAAAQWYPGSGGAMPAALIPYLRVVASPASNSIPPLDSISTMSAYITKAAATLYTITASPGTGGTIFPPGSFYVDSGSNQVFSVTPNTGYLVSDVTVDGVSVGTVTNYTFSNVKTNHTIASTFTPLTLTVTSPQGAPIPGGITTNAYGSVINAYVPSPIANGITQYVATGWIGSGSLSSGIGTNVSFSITNATALNWQWQTNIWVSLNTLGN